MHPTTAFPFCPPGYHGLYCEEEYNECLSAPCLNATTCRDLVNGYECVCLAEYKGKLLVLNDHTTPHGALNLAYKALTGAWICL